MISEQAVAEAVDKSYSLLDAFHKNAPVDFTNLQIRRVEVECEFLRYLKFLQRAVLFLSGLSKEKDPSQFMEVVMRGHKKGIIPFELLEWAGAQPKTRMLFIKRKNVAKRSSSEIIDEVALTYKDLVHHRQKPSIAAVGDEKSVVWIRSDDDSIKVIAHEELATVAKASVHGMRSLFDIRNKGLSITLEMASYISRLPTTVRKWLYRAVGEDLRKLPYWRNCQAMTTYCAVTTTQKYLSALKEFGKFLEKEGLKNKPLWKILKDSEIITHKVIVDWRDQLIEKVVPGTVMNKTSAVLWGMKCWGNKKFRKQDFDVHQDYLEKNYPYVKNHRSAPSHNTILKFWKFWTQCNLTYDEKTVFEMARACYCGTARVTEIMDLKRENIIEESLETNCVQIFPDREKSAKKRGRVLPICFAGSKWWSVTNLLKQRAERRKYGDHLYTNYHGQPLNYSYMNRVHKRYWKKFCEVYPQFKGLKDGFHMYRSSKACQMREAGAKSPDIKILGRWNGGQNAYLQKREIVYSRKLATKVAEHLHTEKTTEIFESNNRWDSIFSSKLSTPKRKREDPQTTNKRQKLGPIEELEQWGHKVLNPKTLESELTKIVKTCKSATTKKDKLKMVKILTSSLLDIQEKLSKEAEKFSGSPDQKSVRKELDSLGEPPELLRQQAVEVVKPKKTFGKKRKILQSPKFGTSPNPTKKPQIELSPKCILPLNLSPDILNLKGQTASSENKEETSIEGDVDPGLLNLPPIDVPAIFAELPPNLL